jgi:hypothetical protein
MRDAVAMLNAGMDLAAEFRSWKTSDSTTGRETWWSITKGDTTALFPV